MNNPEVLKLFRVNRNRTGSVRNWRWTECNKWDGWTIKDKLMETQIHPNTSVHMQHMLDLSKEKGFKVLVYVGENDFQMNWFGLEKVLHNLDWSGKAQFNEDNDDKYVEWDFTNQTTGGQDKGGYFQELDKFTFLKIDNAGLKVHQERPALMVDLLLQWINDPNGHLRGNRDIRKIIHG